jgi:hypothetical protein
MKRKKINLDNVEIAQSCSADWESMTGDDKIRFCVECQNDVYNFAEMTKREAESLLQITGGQICARIARDAEGTVITANPLVGLSLVNLRASKFATAVVTAALSLSNSVVAGPAQKDNLNAVHFISQQTEKKELDQENASKNQLSSLAAIKGTIFDSRKVVIAGARIELSNETTKEVFKTVSGNDGTYKIESLPPGSYKINIYCTRYLTFKAEGVELYLNQEITLDATMVEMLMGGVAVAQRVNLSTVPERHPGKNKSRGKITNPKKKN